MRGAVGRGMGSALGCGGRQGKMCGEGCGRVNGVSGEVCWRVGKECGERNGVGVGKCIRVWGPNKKVTKATSSHGNFAT